jgi:hypothetical protein
MLGCSIPLLLYSPESGLVRVAATAASHTVRRYPLYAQSRTHNGCSFVGKPRER